MHEAEAACSTCSITVVYIQWLAGFSVHECQQMAMQSFACLIVQCNCDHGVAMGPAGRQLRLSQACRERTRHLGQQRQTTAGARLSAVSTSTYRRSDIMHTSTSLPFVLFVQLLGAEIPEFG